MKITDIQRQRKRSNRYSIYLAGEYAFSLDDLEFSNSNLAVGDELTQAEAEQWRAVSDESKAYARALAYLALRQRTRHELQVYLSRYSYHDKTIQAILERLEAKRMIDDQAFAASWIADRQALKPRSRRMIEQELRAKGIASDELEDAMGRIKDDDEQVALKAIIAKKTKLSRYRDESKLITFLVGRGFGYDQIKRVLNQSADEVS